MRGFYFDEHLNRVIADQLTACGIVVVMAVDVGMISKDDDAEHLPYATKQNLVMVTFDHPFAGRTQGRNDHPGLICFSHSIRQDLHRVIELLIEFHALYDSDRDSGQVFWLR